MSKIPYDIISDIFLRLPPKPLSRFKSLSTTSSSIISDPDFIRLHLTRSKKTKSNLNLILKSLNLYTIDFNSLNLALPIDFPFTIASGAEAFGSCNGLIGLRNSENFIALFNPSTRKSKKLPIAPIQIPPEAAKSGYVFYGFGQDIISNDYKVVRMTQFYKNDDDSEGCCFDYEVRVYSLMNNSWEKIHKIKIPPYLKYLFLFFYTLLHRRGYGVLANGVLHWVLPPRVEMGYKNIIVGFDLAIDEFIEVEQPEQPEIHHDYQSFLLDLGVLEGCLCMICNYNQVNVDIWIMKEYGIKESWTRLLSIKKTIPVNLVKFVRPLVYSKDGLKVLLEMDSQKLVWYDLERKKTRKVKIEGAPDSFSAEVFVGSLVPLDNREEEESKRRKKEELEDEELKRSGKKRDDFLSAGFKLVL